MEPTFDVGASTLRTAFEALHFGAHASDLAAQLKTAEGQFSQAEIHTRRATAYRHAAGDLQVIMGSAVNEEAHTKL